MTMTEVLVVMAAGAVMVSAAYVSWAGVTAPGGGGGGTSRRFWPLRWSTGAGTARRCRWRRRGCRRWRRGSAGPWASRSQPRGQCSTARPRAPGRGGVERRWTWCMRPRWRPDATRFWRAAGDRPGRTAWCSRRRLRAPGASWPAGAGLATGHVAVLRRGFSLIELIVVVAAGAMLVQATTSGSARRRRTRWCSRPSMRCCRSTRRRWRSGPTIPGSGRRRSFPPWRQAVTCRRPARRAWSGRATRSGRRWRRRRWRIDVRMPTNALAEGRRGGVRAVRRVDGVRGHGDGADTGA